MLRHPTAGETSASLLRLLGAGRPTLVTATGSFAELPPTIVTFLASIVAVVLPLRKMSG